VTREGGSVSNSAQGAQKLRTELHRYALAHPTGDPRYALCPTQKHPQRGLKPNTCAHHFRTLCRLAGIANASSDSGLRTLITQLASKGVPVRVLASLAGHRSIATTQRYIDANDEMKRSAVELI
jgi:integrase/recombinase XerD